MVYRFGGGGDEVVFHWAMELLEIVGPSICNVIRGDSFDTVLNCLLFNFSTQYSGS